MHPLLIFALATLFSLLAGAALCHLIPRLGPPGRALSAWLSRGVGLDLAIAYFTVIPLIAGPVAGARAFDAWWGWLAGLGVAVAVMVLTVCIWTPLHELAHPKARKGPRLVKSINRNVGAARNHSAVWITALAVPLFAMVRLAEWIVYPPLTWLIRLPKYNSAEWVNISRYKFDGLVGHDLIWCLYCDWMTGVWSLGTEMLRNVESFWCPIRFDSSKKCANCRIDFPDVDNGWAPADATIADAAAVIDAKYPGPNNTNPWFGHPARLTVEGKPADG
ncbi:MAG: hypothetical protein DHS20C14_00820 [Phycisphaeraceae bacterium]|nr:MAG: hypothetical protein DHS20C14_00820 [Phycisphaeraceae bacterium]